MPGSTSSTSGPLRVSSGAFRCLAGLGVALILSTYGTGAPSVDHACGAEAEGASGATSGMHRNIPCGVRQRLAEVEFAHDRPAPFVEESKVRLLRKPTKLHGVVWLERDGALVMRVLEPYVEERRIEGGQLVLIRPSPRHDQNADEAIANGRRLSRPLNPARGADLALWTARQVLSRDADALAARFAASALEPESDGAKVRDKAWAVELLPRNEAMRRELRAIRLYGESSRLERIHVDHGPNQWRDMRLVGEQEPPAETQASR